jgi:hypothetical protein
MQLSCSLMSTQHCSRAASVPVLENEAQELAERLIGRCLVNDQPSVVAYLQTRKPCLYGRWTTAQC